MAGPVNLVMKRATEYRVGGPEGAVHVAEATTILTLVSLIGDHAVCEKNGSHIVIAAGPPREGPLPAGSDR
jgi:hypothetical protein